MIGSYHVSENGVVRRAVPGGPNTAPGRVLKPTNARGRLVVTMTESGVARAIRLTELMAHVWMGGVPAGFKVGFKDGNKMNVALSNLHFVPLLKPPPEPRVRTLEKPWNTRLTEEAVAQIRAMVAVEQAERMTLRKIADKFGVSESLVCKIAKGKAWKTA